MKHLFTCPALMLSIALAQFATGQAKAIRDFTPAEKAVLDSYGQQVVVAMRLLREGKASDALAQATAAIAKLEALKPMDIPGDYYVVAQCHLALDQRSLALADFKKCFIWDEDNRDLSPRIGDWAGCAADYAIALSQNGQIDDAKAIYYYALRKLNPYGDRGWEPYPFVVVFDSSKEGDVWRYSTQRFEAACLMLKAIAAGDGQDSLKWVTRASNLVPSWIYPHVYRGFVHADRHPEADFARAHSLAISQQDHDLIDRVASYNRDHMPASTSNPAEERASITLLHSWKESLAKSHSALAAGSSSRAQ